MQIADLNRIKQISKKEKEVISEEKKKESKGKHSNGPGESKIRIKFISAHMPEHYFEHGSEHYSLSLRIDQDSPVPL